MTENEKEIESKFTQIPNDILHALMRTKLSSYQSRIIWAIFRKTYGWHKKKDWIANKQLVDMTGIRKQHISRTVRELIDRKIVTKSGNKIGFHENYTQWRELPKQVTVTSSGNKVTDSGNGVTSSGEHKRNYTKETSCPDSERLSGLLADLILQNNPTHSRLSNSKYDKTVVLWAKDIDKMIRIDERPVERVERIIKWCQADSFWQSNILSGSKLREQFDQLVMKANQQDNKKDWRDG